MYQSVNLLLDLDVDVWVLVGPLQPRVLLGERVAAVLVLPLAPLQGEVELLQGLEVALGTLYLSPRLLHVRTCSMCIVCVYFTMYVRTCTGM